MMDLREEYEGIKIDKMNSEYRYSDFHLTKYKFYQEGTKQRVLTIGIDYGAKLTLLEKTPRYLIIQKGGGKTWYGLGTQKYYLPEFILFERVGDKITKIFSIKYDQEHKREVWIAFIKEVEKNKKKGV